MSEGRMVSIIFPCRDEEGFIAGCLDSIIASDYPKDRLEVLVVDGMSRDGTRDILAEYTKRHPFIRMIENPGKITPSAFNIGIAHSKGEVIIIMGVHAFYAADYISKCVRYLYEYGVDNVGGVMRTLPRGDGLVARAIAQALSHRFGVGGSVFRTGSKKPVLVDTVFGGCYKKEVFERVGKFNEALVKHQDMEFNRRLRDSGGRILLVPDIVCHYYARTDLRSFAWHNWGNGLSVIESLGKSSATPVALRHLVPMSFVFALAFLSALSAFSAVFVWPLAAVAGSYLLAALYYSGRICIKEGDFRYLLVMPAVFFLLHASHGMGSLFGAIKLVSSRSFWTDRVFARPLAAG